MWLQRQVAPQQQLCRSLHTYTAPSTAARRRTLAGNRHTPLAAQSVSAPVSDIDVNQLYQGHVQLAGSSIGPVKAIRVVGASLLATSIWVLDFCMLLVGPQQGAGLGGFTKRGTCSSTTMKKQLCVLCLHAW